MPSAALFILFMVLHPTPFFDSFLDTTRGIRLHQQDLQGPLLRFRTGLWTFVRSSEAQHKMHVVRFAAVSGSNLCWQVQFAWSVLTMGGKPQVSEKVKGEPQRKKEKRGQEDTKNTSKKARARCHLDGRRQRSQPQPRDDATAVSCISAFCCEAPPPALFGQELVPTGVRAHQ